MVFGLLFDERFLDHKSMGYHPESPKRLTAMIEGLDEIGALESATLIIPREASLVELLRIHTKSYVENTLKALGNAPGHLDPDTFFSEGSKSAALHAAGGTIDLASAVHDRSVDFGLALVRPPGHHAKRNKAGGFCIFNNIAAAASSLLASSRSQRVVIIDPDVHHGNGTQDQFWDNPDVLFLSVHQWPHFPGSGLADEIGGALARGRTVNVPLPPGYGDGDYKYILEELFIPLITEFEPDHILVSTGFDGHANDPLSAMELSSSFYGYFAQQIHKLANVLCEGRLTFVIEGGYDLRALKESIQQTYIGLVEDFTFPLNSHNYSLTVRDIVQNVKKEISPFWPGMFQ